MNRKECELIDLACEYEDQYRALLACDPSLSEDAQKKFIEIQAWGERIHEDARRKGFTWEEVKNAADV